MKSESTIASVSILAGLLAFLPILVGGNRAKPQDHPTVAAATPAPAGPNPRDAVLLAAAEDPAIVALGKENYASFCLACHGTEDTTIDSPSNLFNGRWHHGETPSAIERSILVGLLDLGMPGWSEILAPEDTTALTAYLLSVQR